MKTKKINDEVIAIDEPITWIARSDVRDMTAQAKKNPRKRMRICVHRDDSEKLQEMFIVHTKDTYVRPHKHLNRAESIEILEGKVDVVLFSDDGSVTNVVTLSDYASGGVFYYRMAAPVYHMFLIRTEHLLFKESTTGPFVRTESAFAPWSPDESDPAAVARYVETVERRVAELKK